MYKFTGKVSVEETGIGIPNLTIRVYNVAKAQVTTKKVVGDFGLH